MTSALNLAPLLLAYATLFFVGTFDNARGAVLPVLLKDLGLSDTQGSLFFFTASCVAFLVSLAYPWLRKWTSDIGLLRVGIFSASFGFMAMRFAVDLPTLLIGAAIFGIGFGTTMVAQNLVVVNASPPHLHTRLLSGLHSQYALASVLAPLVVNALFFAELHWQQIFFLLGAAALVLGLGSLWVRRPEGSPDAPSESTLDPEIRSSAWFFVISYSFYFWGELAIASRLPLYLTRTQGYSVENANYYLTYFFIAMLVGRTGFSFFKPEISRKAVIFTSFIATILCSMVGLLVHPIGFVIAGFTLAPSFPFMLGYVKILFPNNAMKVTSLAIATGSVTIMSMHVIIGTLTDRFGIAFSFWTIPITQVLGLVSIMLHSRIFNKNR